MACASHRVGARVSGFFLKSGKEVGILRLLSLRAQKLIDTSFNIGIIPESFLKVTPCRSSIHYAADQVHIE